MQRRNPRFAQIVVLLSCSLALVGALYAQRPFRRISDSRIRRIDTRAAGLAAPGRMGLRSPDVPAGPERRLSRPFRWRLAAGHVAVDAGYPPADRAFAAAVRRLTRIDARSVEEARESGRWRRGLQLAVALCRAGGRVGNHAASGGSLRDYLLRGGFFMADDFHGAYEWQMFVKRIRMVFPDRPIVEIPNNDPIFHTVFDLDDRYQIPGAEHLRLGYKVPDYPQGPDDGKGAHWRAHPRRQGPHHGRHIVQLRYRRFVGMVGPTAYTPSDFPISASASASITSSTR